VRGDFPGSATSYTATVVANTANGSFNSIRTTARTR
jgi:hypothetical protein